MFNHNLISFGFGITPFGLVLLLRAILPLVYIPKEIFIIILKYLRLNNILLFTACNRTYMGDVGRTYELEVRRPREDHLPFICHLNFTAIGGNYGDIIQVREYYLFNKLGLTLVCHLDFQKITL